MSYAKAFNFDSLEPVKGEVFDQPKEEFQQQVFHFAIEWMFIADLLFGAWTLGMWWIAEGFIIMQKFVPAELMNVIHGGMW